ncbi:replication-relaxation family protein [Polymorphospora rubra]|uniref:replication-relaxation family protein n=1 Tax=Polymorphospora rubra TaxID=338584 RepID=UPI003CCE66CF
MRRRSRRCGWRCATRGRRPGWCCGTGGWTGPGWQEWNARHGYGSRRRRITPDAVALVDVDHAGVVGTAAVFIEVDLASMTQVLLREKVGRYLAYAADRAWDGVWPNCPPLLLLTTTASRAATFVAAAGKMLAASRRGNVVYGGQAGRDIAAAEALVVAACGLVRDPDTAAGDVVWMLPQEEATLVSLPELLAERIEAQARARHWLAEADAAADRDRLVDELRAVDVDDVGRLLAAPAAAAMLEFLAGSDPGRLVDEPELAEILLAWWTDRDDVAGDRLRRLLTDRHAREWARQVDALLTAVDAQGDQPRLCVAATRLLRHRLLSRIDVDLLGTPLGRTREQLQADLLDGYQADRDAAAAAAYARLSRRARRTTSVEQLAGEHDQEHLLVCDVCRIVTRRPAPGEWPPGEFCTYCGDGEPVPYERHDQVPTLDALVDELRAVAGNQTPVADPLVDGLRAAADKGHPAGAS